jgi:hypothetical protein
MISLLTVNGIPPQIVGSLTVSEQNSISQYANCDRDNVYHQWQKNCVITLKPFAAIVAGAANSFVRWGSHIGEKSVLRLRSSYLEIGGATFPGDCNLHSDTIDAQSKLREDGLIIFRMLCVSSIPSEFINLTDQLNMDVVLDQHRINGGRFYETALLSLAESKGEVVRPNPWDVVVFDATTPHKPNAAKQPHRRILQQAWIEMQLPSDWQARVENGDAPKLQLTATTGVSPRNLSLPRR